MEFSRERKWDKRREERRGERRKRERDNERDDIEKEERRSEKSVDKTDAMWRHSHIVHYIRCYLSSSVQFHYGNNSAICSCTVCSRSLVESWLLNHTTT